MTTRLSWLAAAVVLLDLSFIGWSAAVNQLHVVVETAEDVPLTLNDARTTQELRRSPAPNEMSVRVSALGPGSVLVPPLLTGHGATLFDATEYSPSGFALDGELRGGGGFRSLDAGTGSLTWHGRVAGVTVGLPCGEGRGTACVEAEGLAPECHDLGGCPGFYEVKVPSGAVTHTGLVPFWRTSLELESLQPVHVRRAAVRFGTRTLLEREGFVVSGREPLGPLSKSVFGLVGGLGLDAATLLGQLLLLIGVMVAAGVCLVTPVVERLGLLEALLLAFFVGQGLSANLTTTLAWVAPTSVAWPLVLTVLGLLGAAQLWRGGWRRWQRATLATSTTERRVAGALALVATLSCLVVAFPAVAFPGWFVGQGYADSVEYAGWASLAHEAPLDRAFGAIRFQDFIRLAMTAHTLGVDTREAFGPQLLVLWWVFPFLAWALLRRLRLGELPALAGAALAAHGFCFFEIGTQCYLPHYEVAHLGVAGVWAALWFVDDEAAVSSGSGRRWAEVVLAAVFAAGVGLYPYQAFSVMGFGLAFVLVAIARRQPSTFWSAARVGVATALLCNVSLEVVLDFGQGTMKYRDGLNGLARNIVFPWYASREAAGILAGADDFVRTSLLADSWASELFAAMPRSGARFMALEGLIHQGVPAVTVALLVFVAGGLLLLASRRDRGALVAVLTVLVPALLALKLMRTGDVYFWVKCLMTLAALMVVPFAGFTMRLFTSKVRPLAGAAGLMSLAFLLVSLRTAWFDSVSYFMPRESTALAQARTHLAVHGAAMWQFERWVDALPHGQRFVFLGKLDDRYWTDGDWVTYNRLLQQLEGHHVWYGDDETRRYTRSREVGYRGARPLSSFDYAISFDACQPRGDATLALHTDAFCVFAVSARGGGVR